MKRHKRADKRGKANPAFCPLSESAAISGLTVKLARRLADNGTWASCRINNRIYVYRAALMEWLASQAGKKISA